MTFASSFGRTFSPTFQPKSQAIGGITTVIYDEFTDTDATGLTTHTPNIAPSGVNWANLVSAGKIYSNRAQQDGDGSSVIDSGIADCTITAKILSSYTGSGIETRQCGIIFRYDGTDYWKVTVNAAIQIFYITKPGGEIVATRNITVAAGELMNLKVVLSGNVITCYLNDANMITYTDELNNTATKHGYWLFRRTSSPYTYCDDFKIETL